MKTSIKLCFISLLFILPCLCVTDSSVAQVTLEVLNPRGEIEPPKALGISPRLSDLSGKRIGLYDNGKQGFKDFLDVIETLFNEKYPTVTIKRYHGAFDLGQDLAGTMAQEVDAFIYGSGD